MTKSLFGPAQQPWVLEIPIMQQSVLFAAIRAPDGIRKDHPVKVLMRWYRRCILFSAFDRKALTNPFVEGGGSFTGPFTLEHALAIFPTSMHDAARFSLFWNEQPWNVFNLMRKEYLRYVDELPHHFQLHFMHAAQIVGVHHGSIDIRKWWKDFYLMIVNDARLQPESDHDMNMRLSDNSDAWRAREEVVAR